MTVTMTSMVIVAVSMARLLVWGEVLVVQPGVLQ